MTAESIQVIAGVAGVVGVPLAAYGILVQRQKDERESAQVEFNKKLTEAVEGKLIERSVAELQTVTAKLVEVGPKLDKHIENYEANRKETAKQFKGIKTSLTNLDRKITANNVVAVQTAKDAKV